MFRFLSVLLAVCTIYSEVGDGQQALINWDKRKSLQGRHVGVCVPIEEKKYPSLSLLVEKNGSIHRKLLPTCCMAMHE
jgi:hypothetical protein